MNLSLEDIKNINALKGLFQKCPLRAYPIYDSEHPFILDTDFSATAVGGVLSQVQGGSERFIGCLVILHNLIIRLLITRRNIRFT